MTIRISASSLKLFRSCPKRWYFAKVLKHREPETDATNLGKETHTQLEAWGKAGTIPKSTLAVKMLASLHGYAWWPDPAVTETEFGFEFDHEGVPFLGFMDFRRAGATPGRRIIGDWKSTGNLQYALRYDNGLLVDSDGHPDVQSSLYAAYEYLQGADLVTAVWVYGQTKPPNTTRLVTGDLDRGRVMAQFAEMMVDARAMLALAASGLDANAVPFNTDACFAFKRPCPFSDRCLRGDGGMFAAPNPLNIQDNPMALDFLTAIRASALATDAPPPPPPADDDAPPPPPADDDAPPPPPADEVHPAELIALAAVAQPATRAVETVEAGFINPPEAAGKAPYATPAEAAVGEGVVAPAPKAPKAAKGKKKVTLDEPVGGGLTLGDAIAEMRQAPVATNKADETLKAMYALLKAHFED